jgi:hypothetical protein
MLAAWYRDLYKIGSAAGATAVVFRVALAVGIPLIGGVYLGHARAAVARGRHGALCHLERYRANTESSPRDHVRRLGRDRRRRNAGSFCR